MSMYNEFIHLQQENRESRDMSPKRMQELLAVNESTSEAAVEILHEPPFDQIRITSLHDLQNMGYWDDVDVSNIKDIRMLVNYYSFLQTPYCKSNYERLRRNYEKVLHRASCALLSAIATSEQCANIPTAIGKTELTYSAREVARILIINCNTVDWRYDYNKRRDEINILVDDMRYYFYAHIDRSVGLGDIYPLSESK